MVLASILVLGTSLGVGLGVGLKKHSSTTTASSSLPTSTSTPTLTTTNTSVWQPSVGSTWQIVLSATPDTSLSVSLYDIDLFDTPASTITTLHSASKKAICYFSAGSYEDWRSDASSFLPSDLGNDLDGWPGEKWLDVTSANVRSIMAKRLDMAVTKGCDGVDPDNIDGYDPSNDSGFSFTQADSVNYLDFLATEAHDRGLAIGLKNGGAIVNDVIGVMQWEVNEQCLAYNECSTFQPFIQAGKPVFHIEYPDGAPDISASVKEGICGDETANGFSTLLKDMDLDNWVESC